MIARKAISALVGAGAIVLLLAAILDSLHGSVRALLWWCLALVAGAVSYYVWPPDRIQAPQPARQRR